MIGNMMENGFVPLEKNILSSPQTQRERMMGTKMEAGLVPWHRYRLASKEEYFIFD
jgi:hypothetical protein